MMCKVTSSAHDMQWHLLVKVSRFADTSWHPQTTDVMHQLFDNNIQLTHACVTTKTALAVFNFPKTKLALATLYA